MYHWLGVKDGFQTFDLEIDCSPEEIIALLSDVTSDSANVIVPDDGEKI